jgi:hypothetical protein
MIKNDNVPVTHGSEMRVSTKGIPILFSIMVILASTAATAWGPPEYGNSDDPDGDRLTTKEEMIRGTDPLQPDTDGGGCWDGWEVANGLDPLDHKDDRQDADGDGWSNYREFLEGTDPLNPNTDGDDYPFDSADPYPLVPNEKDGTPPDGFTKDQQRQRGGGEGNPDNVIRSVHQQYSPYRIPVNPVTRMSSRPYRI